MDNKLGNSNSGTIHSGYYHGYIPTTSKFQAGKFCILMASGYGKDSCGTRYADNDYVIFGGRLTVRAY